MKPRLAYNGIRDTLEILKKEKIQSKLELYYDNLQNFISIKLNKKYSSSLE